MEECLGERERIISLEEVGLESRWGVLGRWFGEM